LGEPCGINEYKYSLWVVGVGNIGWDIWTRTDGEWVYIRTRTD